VLSGIVLQSIFKIKSTGIFIPFFLGLFAQCFLLTCLCFFYKLGLGIFLLNTIIQIGIFIWQKKRIKECLRETLNDIKSLNLTSKLIIFSILFFSLLKCAQLPFIIDNESYYLQTIKWFNEYGFVKGLGNLHFFFAQTSPFHALQAGFNFNFLTNRINDLNGLILVLSSVYFTLEFKKKYLENKKIHWIGLIIFFNILFFQFINAPSPDLLIMLLSQVIFYLYIDQEDNISNFKVITILFLFIFFIKIIIAPIGLIILLILYKDINRIIFFVVLSVLLMIILIFKNIIITGYPLFPFNFFALDVNWRMPENLLNFIIDITKNAGYAKEVFVKNLSLFTKLSLWLKLGGINIFFNYGIILLFVLALFIREFKVNIKYKRLYLVMLVHFLILLLTSPQFRFFLAEFIFLSVIILQFIINYLKINFRNICLLILTTTLLQIPIIELVDYKIFTQNKLHQTKTNYRWSQVFIPEKNSKYSHVIYENIKDGNLEYSSPKENFFFYGTGDGNLPCVNKVQIDYFKKYYFIIPQLRTGNLKDGFYAKKIQSND
jgi:hypothetical protein